MRLASLVALVGVGLGCSAASTDAPGWNGPLGKGGDHITECMVKQHASQMVVGWDVVRNSSSDPVTLDRAVLVGASGVSLTGARVADVRGDKTLFGHANGNPPTRISGEQRQLVASSKPLEGFALAPLSTGAIDNVLLYLRLDDPSRQGEIEHLRVYYHQGAGRRFVWQNNGHYILYPGNRCPDD